VREFPGRAAGTGSRWLISNGGGGYPVWSRHGQKLFFRAMDKIMVAAYTVTGNSFAAVKPRVWSEKTIANVGFLGAYDVGPDGKRIAALATAETPTGQNAQSHVIFLLNFFDELRRRVTVGGE
jgi:hypothetical protein